MENFKNYAKSLNIEKTKFVGHEVSEADAQILKIFTENHEETNSLKGLGFVIFNQTPFYAMGGGQDSDKGTLSFNGVEFELEDVRKDLIYGYYIHQINTGDQELKVGDRLFLKIDQTYRDRSSINHSAMHTTWQTTLNEAGHYIEELGSKLNDEKYQVQFVVDEAITEELILKVVNKINNEIIPQDIKVNIFEVTQQEAIEKDYLFEFTKLVGDEMVRMVEFPGIVIEPCSGTHAKSTKELSQVWFLVYDKNSKRILLELTTNAEYATKFFNEKLIDRFEEIKAFIKKGYDNGLTYDFSEITNRCEELVKIWNPLSVKEINLLHNNVTLIVNKYLKERETEMIKNFASQVLPFEIINNKFKLITLTDEMYTNKVLMAKASQEANEDAEHIIILANKHQTGANVVIIRNKNLDIDLKEFNANVIIPQTTFKGGGTNSMIQLVSQNSEDIEILKNLLK
ncbi:alanine--tRNA ligase-related protein [Mesoplasma seiffertii]|uniref:alanine--tRNA ligase-related protein n=1 Tax=Mesoplasma seiffertii TaxID=28224 RepID=UPI00047A9DD4|nr:alanine--tRNA ligase-related protein [Mesoplasma seiffertii]